MNSGEEGAISGEVVEEKIVEVVLPKDGQTEDEVIEITGDETKEKTNEELKSMYTIEGEEGDLMSLQPEAYDPDGDDIIYTFSEPFDEKGLWQTIEGDAGKYSITVTATDGELSTSENILIVINPTNKAPIIECLEKIVVKEGENVVIDCNIYDVEEDEFEVEYLGWMNSTEKETTYEDAGTYNVVVRAYDAEKSRSAMIEIVVENVNRAPVISGLEDELKVMETELLELDFDVSDPDGNEVEIEYSEPFNEKGVWQTKMDDVGVYDVYVLAKDGQSTTKKEFQIVVTQMNTAPKLVFMPLIEVDEGEIINLPIDASDREGDALEITINGWFKTQTHTTTYNDAGNYSVEVVVSDGELKTSQKVFIIVNDVNRAPVFKIVG